MTSPDMDKNGDFAEWAKSLSVGRNVMGYPEPDIPWNPDVPEFKLAPTPKKYGEPQDPEPQALEQNEATLIK